MQQMECSKCQKLIDNDSKFCEFCGEKITVPKKDPAASCNNANFNNQGEVLPNAEREAAKQEITLGVVFVIVGALITWVSYSFASGGGTYFIFWGLIVYGVYKIIRGFNNLSS